MLKNSIVVLIFIGLLVLGGIYGQLLTTFWVFTINVVAENWIPITIIFTIVWFIKDKSKEIKKDCS